MRWATNVFENDLFLAARLGANDEHDTAFVVSVLGSLNRSSRIFNAEFRHRLSDSWSLQVEGAACLEIDPDDAAYSVRRDSHLGVNLDYHF